MAANPTAQLVDILSQHESLSAEDLARAVRLHEEGGGPLAEVLVRESLLEEDDIFFLLSRSLGLPAIPEERLLHLTLSPEIRRRVSPALARAAILVPLDLDVQRGLLSVAMFDPSDRGTLAELQRCARVTEIRTYLARRSAILNALRSVYGEDDGVPPTDAEELPFLAPLERRDDEAKVKLDPGLAEEIATLSDDSPAGRVARALWHTRQEREPARPFDEETPFPDAVTGIHEVRGRSLLRVGGRPSAKTVIVDDEDDDPLESSHTETAELHLGDIDLGDFVEAGGDDEPPGTDEGDDDLGPRLTADLTPPRAAAATQVTPLTHISAVTLVTQVKSPPGGRSASLHDVRQLEQVDALLGELLSSVGVLVAMLEERIDPTGGAFREYGRVCRLVARELGLDELAVSRISLAAHLYGLDIALRRELGMTERLDVTTAFADQPSAPGGLGPSLRLLGAKSLDLAEDEAAPEPLGVPLIRLVADYLDLRAESEEGAADLETVAQLLRTGGGDPVMIDALVRAVEASEIYRVRLVDPRTLT